MIWLTWRQFRIQALVGVALLVVVAGALAATAPRLFDLYDLTGLQACTAECDKVADAFLAEVKQASLAPFYLGATIVMFLLPGLVGVFWGAPLVARELETGTYRLVWSQTISRGRWVAVKLTAVGLSAMLLAGLISLAVTWWSAPIDDAGEGRLTPLFFAARGIVPIGYAAFAFVAGVLTGLLTRRTVLAMAVTLLLVALVQIALPVFVRPVLATPVVTTAAFDATRIQQMGIHPDNSVTIFLAAPAEGAWVLDNRTIDATGATYTGPVDQEACGRGGPQDCEAWLATQNLRQDVAYVPAEQFWSLQWREFGLFLGLTTLLSLFALWWIRRRVA